MLDLGAAWTEERGADPFDGSAKTAEKATAFTVTYGGTDKTLLDNEIGQFLAVGSGVIERIELVAGSYSWWFGSLAPRRPNTGHSWPHTGRHGSDGGQGVRG